MVFDKPYELTSEEFYQRSRRKAQAPWSPLHYSLLATTAACQNLKGQDIARERGLSPDFIDRLHRSRSGIAFVGWFEGQSAEFRDQFRLKSDREMDSAPDASRAEGNPKRSSSTAQPSRSLVDMGRPAGLSRSEPEND